MEQTNNRYQCSINHFAGSRVLFEVEAVDKADALVKAKEHVRNSSQFWGGNYFEHTIKVIKKIQK